MKTPGDHVVKTLAELATEPVEAVIAEDLAPGAFAGPLALAGADDHDDLAFGHASEQPLNERCSEEARRSGHGDSPAGEVVGDHGCVSSTRLSKSLTTSAAQMAREAAEALPGASSALPAISVSGARREPEPASWGQAGGAPWAVCSACWAWAPNDSRATCRWYESV